MTFLNKKLEISSIDEDFDEIPDDLVQEKYLGDEAKTMSIKMILSTIVDTKALVRYVKAVSNHSHLSIKAWFNIHHQSF